jgi:hypothetical protein
VVIEFGDLEATVALGRTRCNPVPARSDTRSTARAPHVALTARVPPRLRQTDPLPSDRPVVPGGTPSTHHHHRAQRRRRFGFAPATRRYS